MANVKVPFGPVKGLRSLILAKLKGLVNGVNPMRGFSTVTVSDSTGDIILVEPWRGWWWKRAREGSGQKSAGK